MCARPTKGRPCRTPIHRLLVIDRYEVNPPDFDARRAAAYASPDVMLRDTPDGFRYLKREAGSGSRKPEAGEPGSRKPASWKPTATCACRRPRRSHPHARVRRHRRSQHHAAAAVRRPELRRLQPVRHGHAVQRVLRRQLRAARVLRAVGARHALAAGGARVRHRLVVQRSGLRATGASMYTLDIRQRPAQAAVWVLRPLSARSAAPPRVRLGLHEVRRGERDRSRVRGAAQPERARAARRARRAARRLAGVGVGKLRAPRRLAALGICQVAGRVGVRARPRRLSRATARACSARRRCRRA